MGRFVRQQSNHETGTSQPSTTEQRDYCLVREEIGEDRA